MIFKFLETLIPYINKNETLFCEKNTILFKVPFDINIIQNKCKLNSLKTYFEDNYSFDLKIKFFNSIQSNLGSLLIHNFKFRKTIVFKNTVCAKLNCEICKFISFDEFILLRNGFKLPVLCNGNCESKMSIYIIKCIKCNDLYIGKTELTIEKLIFKQVLKSSTLHIHRIIIRILHIFVNKMFLLSRSMPIIITHNKKQ